jgi:hypothetical protein
MATDCATSSFSYFENATDPAPNNSDASFCVSPKSSRMARSWVLASKPLLDMRRLCFTRLSRLDLARATGRQCLMFMVVQQEARSLEAWRSDTLNHRHRILKGLR